MKEQCLEEMMEEIKIDDLDKYIISTCAMRGGLCKYLLYQFYEFDMKKDEPELFEVYNKWLEEELFVLTNCLERYVKDNTKMKAAYYDAQTDYEDRPSTRELARWVGGRLIRAAEKENSRDFSKINYAIQDLDYEDEKYLEHVENMLIEIDVA